jgi:hypothetical protein
MLGHSAGMGSPNTTRSIHFNIWLQTVCAVQPSRSADLSPLDIYVWGQLTTLVSSPPIENEETLHQRTFNACQTIRNRPMTFERVPQPMSGRVHACFDSGWRCFEHLLWTVTRYKNSTAVKVRSCPLNVLCQSWVKYYISSIYFECSLLTITQKTLIFGHMSMWISFFFSVWRTHSWSLSKNFIYILYTRNMQHCTQIPIWVADVKL